MGAAIIPSMFRYATGVVRVQIDGLCKGPTVFNNTQKKWANPTAWCNLSPVQSAESTRSPLVAGEGDAIGKESMSGPGEASAWAMVFSLFCCQLRTFCEAVLLSIAQGARWFSLWGKEKKTKNKKADDKGNKNNDEEEQYALYEGVVWHERKHPIRHQFEYAVRYALVNLDRVPSWFAAASFRHHLTAKQARSITGTTGPVHLLCMPASVGYEQNPISVYYCYDDVGENVTKAIAEVTNTPWGERVTFEFDPAYDKVAKPLHVSPFMDMAGSWLMHAPAPGEKLALTIRVEHPEFGNFFVATLRAQKVSSVENPTSFSWLIPHKVAVWIYWQAFLLLWKGVAFVQHPKYIDGDAYRKRAQMRDDALLIARSSCSSSSPTPFLRDADEIRHQAGQGGKSAFGVIRDPSSSGETTAGPRRFCSWREAAGPPWL